jgi:mannitol 2-dehydrogenase
MQQGEAIDWGIRGAGVRPADALMRAKLLAQDGLTTLIELAPRRHSAEVIGAMTDFIAVESDNAALIRAMANPATRIVSMTVTEGGYYLDANGAFDAGSPDIAHDVANPDQPCTAFGAMIAALRLRRDAGSGPFTGLSCDNLQGNGAILRRVVVGLARLSDPVLADWIDAECSFPNSMVDCIVPATGSEEFAYVQALGIADAAPVTHENFRQWVLEDDFCAGRPEWDRVGATFTTRVHAYEAMKLRILNSGHQILANAGELLGLTTIAECMAHEGIAALLRKVVCEDIATHVESVPGMEPLAYLDLVATRFANPAIRDTVRRVAFDGSSRHPGFLLPAIRDALAFGTSVSGLALVEALWAHMCVGIRDDGSRIDPNDPIWSNLTACARRAQADPVAWLAQTRIYGDLGENRRFSELFTIWLNRLTANGTAATLQAYVQGGK